MSIYRRRILAGAAATVVAAALPRPVAASPTPPPLPPPPPAPSLPGSLLSDLPADYVGFVEIPRFFPETRHNVDGEFLTHFRSQGGLETFGYPLTEEFWEPDETSTDSLEGASEGPVDEAPGGSPEAAGRMAQYFQRAGLAYDLATKTVRRTPLGEVMGRRQPAVPPLPGVRYFPETGHNLGDAFLAFFEAQGKVRALGHPISEEVEEDGHVVQWFQTARLEWRPEQLPGRQVQCGLIGAEYVEELGSQVPEAARRPATPKEPLREWVLPPPPPPPVRRVPPLQAPILYYHQVASGNALRAQIQAFKEAGRTFVPLGRVVEAMRGEADLPEAPLVLTFDDGWATQFTNALPVLQAEHIPATFFIITRYLGTLPGYMTWDQVRALKELGHEVESHTQNHPSLDVLHAQDAGAALAEVWESLAILEGRLGRSRRLFAYPNGRWDRAVAGLVARVYRAAVATAGGQVQSQEQLYAMRRIKAEPSYAPEKLLNEVRPPAAESPGTKRG